MINQVIIVGRLVKNIEEVEIEEGKKKINITIAVPRSYRNENGEYDTDFIECIIWNGMAQNVIEYCKKGDLLGIKGYLQTIENDEKVKITYVVAEKITFLSSKKEKED